MEQIAMIRYIPQSRIGQIDFSEFPLAPTKKAGTDSDCRSPPLRIQKETPIT